MRLIRFWRIGLGAAIALSGSLAFATDPAPVQSYPECTRKPTPTDLETAKGAHRAASQFYDRGDYEKAISYWTDAYGFDCTAHGVLINIANAYEKQGDKASAVGALETYLKRSGSDPVIEDKVKNLKISLAPPAPSVSASAALPPLPSVVPSAPPPPPPLVKRYGRTPLYVAGGGAAVAVIGGVLLGVGTGTIASLNQECPNRACQNPDQASKGNTGRIEQGVGATGLVVGLAALGGGLAWEFLLNKPRPALPPPNKASFHVLPAAGPHEGGMSVVGSF